MEQHPAGNPSSTDTLAKEMMTVIRSFSDSPITTYVYLNYDDPSEIFRPYDPRFPAVAQRVADLIVERMPDGRVDHVGSTAVPNCPGKGIIDLMLRYPPGRLENARDVLDHLGFQRQTGTDPFPEERPMRVGAITDAGTTYRLHVHVVAEDDQETDDLIRFRDRLRQNPQLLEAYVARKRAALTLGSVDNITYNRTKEPIIRAALDRAEG